MRCAERSSILEWRSPVDEVPSKMPLIEEHLWVLIAIPVLYLLAGIRILSEHERGVMFRLGRFTGVKPAGLRWILPGVDRMARVSLRQIVMEFPEKEVTLRDRRRATVRASMIFHIADPERAVLGVDNYLYETSQRGQDRLLEVFRSARAADVERGTERLASRTKDLVNTDTFPWGV